MLGCITYLMIKFSGLSIWTFPDSTRDYVKSRAHHGMRDSYRAVGPDPARVKRRRHPGMATVETDSTGGIGRNEHRTTLRQNRAIKMLPNAERITRPAIKHHEPYK